jgi:chemotaxis protein MotA
MFTIIGILVVFGAVAGGYVMEHGHFAVLLQPAELVIIGGAALGTLFISNPPHILKGIMAGLAGAFGSSKYGKERYLDTLKMMYELFNRARKEGLAGLESDVEAPDKSKTFSAYPAFMKDHHSLDFVCDSMRMAITGGVDPFDMDQLMETDMDVHHHEAGLPISALSTVADSLPGLGIVAAVLGVVITMGSLGGPPEQIGHKVAAALVGTFLGILLCYGLLGPLASNMSKAVDDQKAYLHVLRVLIISFVRGNSPIIATEIARRAIPGHVRPTFKDMESACRNKTGQAQAQAA